MPSFLRQSIISGLAWASAAWAACQYPDGTDVTGMGYMPCSGEIASCCIQHPNGMQDTCLSNGLCWSEVSKYVYQGACNGQWGSDKCPKYCLKDNTKSFERLFHCQDNEYCCSEQDCCEKSKDVFDLGTPCVEEYLDTENGTTKANTTATSSKGTRSNSCTPWPLAHQSSSNSSDGSDDTDTSEGGSMARNLLIFSLLGCLCVLLVISVAIYFARRNGTLAGGGSSRRSLGIHAKIGNFGHRVMGHNGAFTALAQTPNYTDKKFRDSISSTSDDNRSSAGSPSPGTEIEPMLTPEPARTRHYV